MRTKVAIFAAAALGVGMAAPGTAATTTVDVAAKKKTVSLLYSITADSALLAPVAGKDRVYRMTLRGTDPHMVWFTDRPDRDSGVWSTKMFSSAWDSGAMFDKDPPNVALVLHEPKGGTDTVVAVMGKPRYSANKDRLVARLKVLTAEQAKDVQGGLGQHADRHDGSDLPRKTGAVSLFIDNDDADVTDLWIHSVLYPSNVFRIYWKDGTVWRCVSAATANFQSVFSGPNIKDWGMWFGRNIFQKYGYENAWRACDEDWPAY